MPFCGARVDGGHINVEPAMIFNQLAVEFAPRLET